MGLTSYLVQGANNYRVWGFNPADTSSASMVPWFFDTLDSAYDVGQHVSIALDYGSNTPYISYYDADYDSLKMAKYVGSGGNCGLDNDWNCETVDHTLNVGKFSSIAIDPLDDLPKIAYYDDSSNALKLATYNISGWNIRTIDDPLIGDAGQYASLAVNTTVKVGIAYYFSQFPNPPSLKYASYVGGGSGNCGGGDFQCDFVDTGTGRGKYTSLALDSANQPHIAYYDSDKDALKYAHYDGGWYQRWILSAESGKHASLAIDVNNGDLPHIAHYDGVNGTLEYAVYVGTDGNCGMGGSSLWEWQCDEIDTMGTGTNPRGISLVLDSAGYPIIAYQTGASGIKIARPAAAAGQLSGNCGPATPFYTWQCDLISIGIGIGQGDYLSLAVNSAGLSTIAYYGNVDNSDGDLRFAYQRLQVYMPFILRD
jgi:hypothetical protein